MTRSIGGQRQTLGRLGMALGLMVLAASVLSMTACSRTFKVHASRAYCGWALDSTPTKKSLGAFVVERRWLVRDDGACVLNLGMFEDGSPHIADDESLVYVWVQLPRDPGSAGQSQSSLADLYRTGMRSGPSVRSTSVPVTAEVRAWNEAAIDAVISIEDYGEFDARFTLLEPHREILRED